MTHFRKFIHVFLGLTYLVFSLAACSPSAFGYKQAAPSTLPAPPVASLEASPAYIITPTIQVSFPQPTPALTLAGSIIESGPFTFYLFVYREDSLAKEPVTTSLYSDMNGIGAYMFWKYNGSDPLKSTEEYWGTQPSLNLLNTYSEITAGQMGGRDGGILLPGGFFTPGESKNGDRVEVIIKLKTAAEEYGASISFTLQSAANGFEPAEISMAALKNSASKSGTITWAEKWSGMKPFPVMASSFQLPPDHKTYTDAHGFVIDYPADWLINTEHGVVLASSTLSPKNENSTTIYAAKLDVIVATPSSSWTLTDEINAFQKEQAGVSTLVEMQNLLLEGQVPAARLALQYGTGQSRVLLTVINGMSVRLHGVGDVQMIDAVTNTLRASQ